MLGGIVVYKHTLWHNMRMFQTYLIATRNITCILVFFEIIRALLNVEAKSLYEKLEISITIAIKQQS